MKFMNLSINEPSWSIKPPWEIEIQVMDKGLTFANQSPIPSHQCSINLGNDNIAIL